MKRMIALCLALSIGLGLWGCAKTEDRPLAPSKATHFPQTAQQKALAEAEIRYAISLLLDRNYIVERISQAGEQPASSFVAMGMSDHKGQFYENAGHSDQYTGYFDTGREAYSENFLTAIRILQKYYDFDGREFLNFPTLTYIYNTGDKNKATAEYVQAALALVGIPVELENQEWNSFLSTRKSGAFTIARSGWIADYTDPICFLEMWISTSGNNDIRLGRDEHSSLAVYSLDLRPYGYDVLVEKGTWAQTYDVLIETIKNCPDAEARYKLLHLAEDMLMSTGCVMPLFFYTDLYMLSPRVTGFYSNPLGYKYFHKTLVDGAGDSLSVCLSSEPESIDPGLNATVDGATLLTHLFSGLAKWEQAADGSLVIVPDCAETLPEGERQPDGSVTYTYRLKEGLVWADGAPLTAQDFVYGWNRAKSPELGGDYSYLFEILSEVTAPDDRTLRVTLTGPISYWNEMLAFPTFFPVRADVAADEAWATEAASYVGNGPYKIAQWSHDSVITLVKNEHYHDRDQVSMGTIRFFLSSDANNMLTNFQNGDWLMIDDVPADEIQSLKQKYPEAFRVSGQIGTNYLCWNVNASLLPNDQ